MITDAMIRKPKKVATRLGNFGELMYSLSPKASDAILNTGYKLFPDSKAAKGDKDGETERRHRPKRSPSPTSCAASTGRPVDRIEKAKWPYSAPFCHLDSRDREQTRRIAG